jgi:protein gp37
MCAAMSDKSAIEWTDATWNTWLGCTKVSPGCANCYISRTPPYRMQGLRFERGAIPVQMLDERMTLPLRWRKPRLIFVNSLSDTFHEDVPDDYVLAVFGVMAAADWHTFQVLTKRPERMLALLSAPTSPGRIDGLKHVALAGTRRRYSKLTVSDVERLREQAGAGVRTAAIAEAFGVSDTQVRNILRGDQWQAEYEPEWPLRSVWLGVTAENQRMADARIPLLLDTPAAVRFVSCEPLLGPLDLEPWLRESCDMNLHCLEHADRPALNWVIAGGESGGPGRRRLVQRCANRLGRHLHVEGQPVASFGEQMRSGVPCEGWIPTPEGISMVRSLRDQCAAAGVPFFFKQWGGPRPTSGGHLLDGRTWREMPEAARQREEVGVE